VLSTLSARITGVEPPLGDAALELHWLATRINHRDPSFLLHLGQSVSRSFELPASVQQPPDAPEVLELLELLVGVNNALVSAMNNAPDEYAVDRLFALFLFRPQAIVRFAGFAPSAFLSVTPNLEPPAVLTCAAFGSKSSHCRYSKCSPDSTQRRSHSRSVFLLLK
jgi:hypothetical protein